MTSIENDLPRPSEVESKELPAAAARALYGREPAESRAFNYAPTRRHATGTGWLNNEAGVIEPEGDLTTDLELESLRRLRVFMSTTGDYRTGPFTEPWPMDEARWDFSRIDGGFPYVIADLFNEQLRKWAGYVMTCDMAYLPEQPHAVTWLFEDEDGNVIRANRVTAADAFEEASELSDPPDIGYPNPDAA